MDPTSAIEQIENSLNNISNNTQLALHILLSLIVLVVYFVLRRFARAQINKRKLTPKQRYRWNQLVHYSLLAVTVLLLGILWIQGISELATILAIILAGLAIALREPLTNIGGWAYIMARRPFELGDRIEVDTVRGDVADISPFEFVLAEVGEGMGAEQPTGRVVHVPNSYVFTHRIANATQGFIMVWDEIPVVVTFESNWRKAKSMLEEILHSHTDALAKAAQEQLGKTKSVLVLPQAATDPIVFTAVIDFGVELTLRYPADVRGRRQLKNDIWEDILRAFAIEDDIDFAYPTQRLYTNPAEGKRGTGGPKTVMAESPSESQ
ncbi:MAG: mechanosensitive ion channel family protein [Caldilineales bacterium]|nr:mechanosensitive ion channel family protein [Caldilineales bacterium]